MFGEWGADGIKVDHMCQGVSCGGGVQGHEMAVATQAQLKPLPNAGHLPPPHPLIP